MEQGTNLTRVGAFNRSVVLDVVRRSPEGVSRATVSDRTGLTPQTVSNIVGRLLDEHLVRERGTVVVTGRTGAAAAGPRGSARSPGPRATRGAPGRLLVLEPRARFAVGVHLDPAHLAVVLLDLGGELVVERHLTDVDLTDPATALPVMAESVGAVVADAGVDRTRVLGTGLATPGPIDRDGSRLGAPSQLVRWHGRAVGQDLERMTGLPVHLEKDAVAGALGERWLRPSTPSDDLVYLYLGHGVSAGLVTGGDVVRGATGNAGEFGAFPVHPDGDPVELWRACQPLPLVRRAVALGLLPAAVDESDPRSVRAAFAALCARAGAAPLVASAGAAIGEALAHVVELLDVSRVVVAGSSAVASGEALLSAVRIGLEARLRSVAPPTVVGSAFGESAVARGAACAVLRSAFAPTADGLALPPRRAGRAVARPSVRPAGAAQTWAPSRLPAR